MNVNCETQEQFNDLANAFLKSFKDHGISLEVKSKHFQQVLDYQDLIGMNTMAMIQAFETNLDQNERQHFIWVNTNCLSVDSFLHILKKTVIRRHRLKIEIEYATENIEVSNRIYSKEKELQEQINWLHEIDEVWRQEKGKLVQEIRRIEMRAREWHDAFDKLCAQMDKDGIRMLLAEQKADAFDEIKRLLEIK